MTYLLVDSFEEWLKLCIYSDAPTFQNFQLKQDAEQMSGAITIFTHQLPLKILVASLFEAWPVLCIQRLVEIFGRSLCDHGDGCATI